MCCAVVGVLASNPSSTNRAFGVVGEDANNGTTTARDANNGISIGFKTVSKGYG